MRLPPIPNTLKVVAQSRGKVLCVPIIASVLVSSGSLKFLGPYPLAEAIGELLPQLPYWTRLKLVYSLASIEVLTGGGLLVTAAKPLALSLASMLLLSFVAFTASTEFLGKTTDCGCFGTVAALNQFAARILILSLCAGCLIVLHLSGEASGPRARG